MDWINEWTLLHFRRGGSVNTIKITQLECYFSSFFAVRWICCRDNIDLVSWLLRIYLMDCRKYHQLHCKSSLQARLGMEEHNEGYFGFGFFLIYGWGFDNNVAHSLIRRALGSNHSSSFACKLSDNSNNGLALQCCM